MSTYPSDVSSPMLGDNFLHHVRALSSAAAVGHGRVIQRHVADLRTRSLTCPALPRP